MRDVKMGCGGLVCGKHLLSQFLLNTLSGFEISSVLSGLLCFLNYICCDDGSTVQLKPVTCYVIRLFVT